MIKSLVTVVCGIVLAILVITVALCAAVYVIGLAARAALFGEPRTSLAVRLLQRISRGSTVITDNTRHHQSRDGE